MIEDNLLLRILELVDLKRNFDVSTGAVVSHFNRNIFVIQNRNRWRMKDGKLIAGLVGVGGKLDNGEPLKGTCKLCPKIYINEN